MADWNRQPTLHFLLVGGLLFAAGLLISELRGGDAESAAVRPVDRSIVVDQQLVDWLRDSWESRWHRPPTANELERLVEDWIRQEVLYRSALELGLGDTDPLVRRRLVERMELVSRSSPAAEPTEEELRERYEVEPDRWARPALRSYTHVFFDPQLRGSEAWEAAERTLEELGSLEPAPARAPELGDPFAMQYDYPNRSHDEVARHMGETFADTLFELEEQGWWGPARSEYGVHLIRVSERSAPVAVPYEQARERIRETLRRERTESDDKRFYDQLSSKYTIVRGDDV